MTATPRPGDVTRLLDELARDVPDAGGRLFDAVYGELHRLAAARMAVQGPEHTLQPTALVHEAYLRLCDEQPGGRAYADRGHFFATAARAMRSILVDHARRRFADRRGGGALRVTLDPELVGGEDPAQRVVRIDELLERMAADHPRAARVVELLFFAGLGVEEAAAVLGTSGRTVKRDWRFGKAWLSRALGDGAS